VNEPLPPIDVDDGPAGHILTVARNIAFQEYYSGLTMDRLAFALGMSKKTIYVHFPSKDAIFGAMIAATGATIRREVTTLLDGPGGFPEKLEGLLRIVSAHFGALQPGFLQDLQRFAPHLSREIDALKEQNVPLLFTRVLRIGVEQGLVRADLDLNFLTEYWLQIVKGIHDPAVLARTGLTPRQAFEKALDLLFRGLLTPAVQAQGRWGDPASK